MTTVQIDAPQVAMSEGACRRYARRYEPIQRDACLAWWADTFTCVPEADSTGDPEETATVISGSSEANHLFALLLDISLTGASIAVDRLPDRDRPVWLRLEGEGVSEWSEADVVGVTTTPHGPHLVRLMFREPCPFETLRQAICG